MGARRDKEGTFITFTVSCFLKNKKIWAEVSGVFVIFLFLIFLFKNYINAKFHYFQRSKGWMDVLRAASGSHLDLRA